MAFDWKSIVKTVAPMLGTALGGPLGGIAGAALSKALGTEGTDEKTLSVAVSGASQETLLALQKAEDDFKITMTQLGFENVQALEKIAADDRADARQREIQLKDKIPAILAIVITIGFFGILAYMLKWAIPMESRDVLNIMLGALGTAWISVVSYYFGSSAGSARKDEIIGGMK